MKVSRAVRATMLALMMLALPAFLPAVFAEPEPNDSFGQAIPVDADFASFTGTLSQTDNVDMYKMMLNRTVSTVESVTAELTKTSANGQVRLYIYDADGYRLAWNATVTDMAVSSSVCAPYSGYVYIGVTAWLGAPDYEYRLNITRTNLSPNMNLLDANNRPSEAVAVQNGYSATERADALYDAGDFYSATLAAGAGWRDVLTVRLAVPAGADLAVELFRPSNSTLIGFSDGNDIFNPDFGASETLYFVAQEGGAVDIRIWAEHGSGDYTLGVSVFRSYQDSDNDLDNATAIPADGTFDGNVSLNYDTDDYCSIILPADATVELALDASGYNASFRLPNLNLHLLDPARNVINSSTAADPSERASAVAASAGTYYIRVSAGRDSAGDYSLKVSTVRPPLVLDPEVGLSVDEDSSTSLDLSDVFEDQKGRPLAFNFTPSAHLAIGWSPSGGGNILDIVPDPDWNGRAVFGINATNLEGKVAAADVNLTVRPVNDPPVAEHTGPLSFSSGADQPFTLPVSVFSLFSDIDGDVLAYSARDPGVLTVAIEADGTVTATPPLYWSGTQTFHIVATDPANATAEVAVALTVVPVNHPPEVAAAVGNITFAEHGSAAVDLNAAFRDPDNDPLSFSALDNVMLGVTIQNGTALVSARDPHWFGNESIAFAARDPSNATAALVVNFTVTMVNDPPYVFRPLQNQSMKEDTPTTLFNLNDYFRDPHADALTFAATGYGAYISVNITSDGWVTFTPAPDWSGQSAMLFTAEDPYGELADLRLNLTVEPVDDAPVLSSPRVSPSKGDTGTEFTFTVVVTDKDSASLTVILKAGRRSMVMERVEGELVTGATYRVRTALPEGDNAFFFQADDGERTAGTDSSELSVSASTPDNTILYISLLALIIIVIALALAFSPSGDRERWKDEEE